MTIGGFLSEEDYLLLERWYRHSSAYIVGSKLEDIGLFWQKLSTYTAEFVAFAQKNGTV